MVRSLVLSVLDIEQYLRLGGGITAQLAMDRKVHFIERPAVSRARRSRPKPLDVDSATLLRPVANGFISNDNPALGHDLFDIPVAETEAKVQPHAVADDLGRESATVIQRFRWVHAG